MIWYFGDALHKPPNRNYCFELMVSRPDAWYQDQTHKRHFNKASNTGSQPSNFLKLEYSKDLLMEISYAMIATSCAELLSGPEYPQLLSDDPT